jgi:hypothetical protein
MSAAAVTSLQENQAVGHLVGAHDWFAAVDHSVNSNFPKSVVAFDRF